MVVGQRGFAGGEVLARVDEAEVGFWEGSADGEESGEILDGERGGHGHGNCWGC